MGKMVSSDRILAALNIFNSHFPNGIETAREIVQNAQDEGVTSDIPSGDMISRVALLQEFNGLCGPQTGDGWDNWGVLALISRQKAVDAIPVEWIRKQISIADNAGDLDSVDCMSWLIQAYAKERDGK